MCSRSSFNKMPEKTFPKHLQKRRKRKLPPLRGIYHNKMLKILVILVCLVNILYHLNIIKISVAADTTATTTPKINSSITTKSTPLTSMLNAEANTTNLRNNISVLKAQKSIRSINVNNSYNQQNQLIRHHNVTPDNIAATKRKLRRKPHNHGQSGGNRTRPNAASLPSMTRYKGKRRKYQRPLQNSHTTNSSMPKNLATLRPNPLTPAKPVPTSPTSSSTPTGYSVRPYIHQKQQQFSYSNRTYQRQHQYQQQSVQIPSSTISVTSTIDHHHNPRTQVYSNGTRFYPTTTTNIQHYIGVNTTNIHEIKYPPSAPPAQQHSIQNQNHVVTDIVVYRNIGPIPCPPGVRLVPHRVITATPDPRLNRQRGKLE